MKQKNTKADLKTFFKIVSLAPGLHLVQEKTMSDMQLREIWSHVATGKYSKATNIIVFRFFRAPKMQS